jgi:hypothetical protein
VKERLLEMYYFWKNFWLCSGFIKVWRKCNVLRSLFGPEKRFIRAFSRPKRSNPLKRFHFWLKSWIFWTKKATQNITFSSHFYKARTKPKILSEIIHFQKPFFHGKSYILRWGKCELECNLSHWLFKLFLRYRNFGSGVVITSSFFESKREMDSVNLLRIGCAVSSGRHRIVIPMRLNQFAQLWKLKTETGTI